MHPELSDKAQTATVLDQLRSASLISIGQLCDDNCVALFSKNNLQVYKNGSIILEGKRNWSDRLWDININNKHENANIILQQDRTKSDYATYIHACMYSPAKSTLLQAIKKGYLVGFPGVTSELINKHLLPSPATAKGHLNQERSNLQSTTAPSVSVISNNDNTTATTATVTTGYTRLTVLPAEKSYSDQTGRFPKRSSRGYQYIFIFYDYDSNAILAEPIKSRSSSELIAAWTKCHNTLTSRGIKPKLHVLDNELSDDMRQVILATDTTIQRVPPHNHRRNAAERAIQTFKNHFIAGLATADPKFPVREWDRLIPQAVLTLNIMRECRINPKLSAYAYLFGQFDFNATPLAPPGTRVIAHEKPQQRATWDPHGVNGWYVGPALEHYRCITCYIPSTGKERVVDTVQWFPHVVPIPAASTDDYLRQAVADIIALLNTRQQHPTLAVNPTTEQIVRQVAELLQRATPHPPTISLPANTIPAPRVTANPSHANPSTTATTNNANPVPIPRVRAPANTLQPNANPIAVPRVGASTTGLQPNENPGVVPRVGASPNVLQLPRVLKNKRLTTNKQQHEQDRPPWTPLHQLRRHQQPAQHFRTTQQRIQHIHTQQQQHCGHVFHPNTGKKQSLKGLMMDSTGEADIWTTACANEFGRLMNGVGGRVKGTNTMRVIAKSNIPADRKVTYANFVCDLRPNKPETHRVRMCVGGDKLTYPESPSSPAAGMTEVKLLLNSTISTEGARFATCDIKDFYLNTPMDRFEYIKIHRRQIPAEIILEYNLHNKFDAQGYLYFEIMKGMYGLKQAGLIAWEQLVRNLAPHGYHPVTYTTGLWTHAPTGTLFTLVVDDFGIKYTNREHAQHLFNTLKKYYTISIDWSGSKYCGLSLDWNYDDRWVQVSIPGFVGKAQERYQYEPTKQRDAPHKWTTPQYGAKIQYAKDIPDEVVLDKAGTQYIQSVAGTFQYYGQAIDSTMLVALNEIGTNQAAPTATTRDKVDWLFDYALTHPTATIKYHASDMILHVESDAAYLVLPKARSRYAGFFHLADHPPDPPALPNPTINGAVNVDCKAIRNVVGSAAEAETAGLYFNAQRTIPIRIALEEMGHPQPPTPIKTDNATALGYVYDNIKQKRSKSFDMKYHWLRDREQQKQFRFYWDKGSNNNADYFTKHHPPAVHREKRKVYFV